MSTSGLAQCEAFFMREHQSDVGRVRIEAHKKSEHPVNRELAE